VRAFQNIILGQKYIFLFFCKYLINFVGSKLSKVGRGLAIPTVQCSQIKIFPRQRDDSFLHSYFFFFHFSFRDIYVAEKHTPRATFNRSICFACANPVLRSQSYVQLRALQYSFRGHWRTLLHLYQNFPVPRHAYNLIIWSYEWFFRRQVAKRFGSQTEKEKKKKKKEQTAGFT
jgi:hypothetical protein